MTDQQTTDRPAHLVVDFDFFNPTREGEDIFDALVRIKRESPPIFWTPRNGGHWVATGADDIKVMQTDFARFSNWNSKFPKTERPFPLYPLESDPPEHSQYRLLIAPSFSPRVIAAAEDHVRKVAIEVIEGLVPKGGCEFAGEFAKVLPIVVFLSLMELPVEDRHELLPHAEAISRARDQAVANAARVKVGEYLERWIEERTARPGNDPISKIVNAEVGGRKLTRPELFGICSLVLVGGLDTVASLIGFAAAHLARHPEDRRRLTLRPETIPAAVDELFRRFGVVNQTRRIVHDTDFGGVPLRQGDYIMMPNVLIGLDDRNTDPMRVDFDRQGAEQAIFGNGPHRCPGANLARREMIVFLEEWLKRIPDFHITPGTTPKVAAGSVNSMTELYLSW